MKKAELIENEWNIYWADKEKKGTGSIAYGVIASAYRKLIIRNYLNHFIKKYVPRNASVLHAGCGSGQVDSDLVSYIHITALDISENALRIYKRLHGEKCIAVKGDIFHLPFEDGSFDAVYNLGVMEHFTQEEIGQILSEFKRVLKPGGRMIIFWPPTFGLSVFVLDSIHFVLNKIFRMKVKLHPDEISRIRSKEHARKTFESAGLKVLEYYFGARDLFTQVMVAAEK